MPLIRYLRLRHVDDSIFYVALVLRIGPGYSDSRICGLAWALPFLSIYKTGDLDANHRFKVSQ